MGGGTPLVLWGDDKMPAGNSPVPEGGLTAARGGGGLTIPGGVQEPCERGTGHGQ